MKGTENASKERSWDRWKTMDEDGGERGRPGYEEGWLLAGLTGKFHLFNRELCAISFYLFNPKLCVIVKTFI